MAEPPFLPPPLRGDHLLNCWRTVSGGGACSCKPEPNYGGTRMAIVAVGRSYFETVFPDDTEILSIVPSRSLGVYDVTVRHRSLPLVGEGQVIPVATVVVERVKTHYEVS